MGLPTRQISDQDVWIEGLATDLVTGSTVCQLEHCFCDMTERVFDGKGYRGFEGSDPAGAWLANLLSTTLNSFIIEVHTPVGEPSLRPRLLCRWTGLVALQTEDQRG